MFSFVKKKYIHRTVPIKEHVFNLPTEDEAVMGIGSHETMSFDHSRTSPHYDGTVPVMDSTNEEAISTFLKMPVQDKLPVYRQLGLTIWVTTAMTFVVASDSGFGSCTINLLAIGGPLFVAALTSSARGRRDGSMLDKVLAQKHQVQVKLSQKAQ